MSQSFDEQQTSLPDYKDNPEAYEIEERSRPDEMLMLEKAGKAAIDILNKISNARVLDLCCGTGLSLESIVDHPNVSEIVGVDISKPYLDYAKKKFSRSNVKPKFILDDAVSAPLPQKHWDLIILASAYHHIEDSRKIEFLQRVSKLLDNLGVAIVAENILPEYQEEDSNSYTLAVQKFYTEVLRTAKNDNPKLPEYVENLIKRVAQYGFDGEYEYKVSLPVFMKDLDQSELQVVSQMRVWSGDNGKLGSTGGNYVFKMSRKVDDYTKE